MNLLFNGKESFAQSKKLRFPDLSSNPNSRQVSNSWEQTTRNNTGEKNKTRTEKKHAQRENSYSKWTCIVPTCQNINKGHEDTFSFNHFLSSSIKKLSFINKSLSNLAQHKIYAIPRYICYTIPRYIYAIPRYTYAILTIPRSLLISFA